MDNSELSASQHAFAQYWDNPKVQALVSFLQERSTHSLEDIHSWEIYRYETDDNGMVLEEETRIGNAPTTGITQDREFMLMQVSYGHMERFTVYFHKRGDVQEGLKGWLRKRVDDTWTVWQYQHTFTSFTNTPMIRSVYDTAPSREAE